MKTLVFDTETSGFYDPKLNLDDPRQGRIVQLACVLLDNEFKLVNSFYSLVKPREVFIINSGAQAAHGISAEMVEKYGINTDTALQTFLDFYNKADCIVAHNIGFDSRMLDTELYLAENVMMQSINWQDSKHICTMREMTPICQLPSTGKFGAKFKWPKLQEAYYHCFNKNFDDAHDAMADVKATAEVFKWLVDGNYIILPKEITA